MRGVWHMMTPWHALDYSELDLARRSVVTHVLGKSFTHVPLFSKQYRPYK